jgi:hypothetical protein
MKDYVLNKKPEPAANETVWAFDLGNVPRPSDGRGWRAATGEGCNLPDEVNTNFLHTFLHKASLLIPAEFEKDKTGKVALAGFVLETLFYAACPHGEQQACQFRSRFALSNFVLIPDEL